MPHYGLVYIIRNNEHPPNVYKVGMTTRSVEERIAELNAETSNIGKFETLAQFPVNKVEAAEAECHRKLRSYKYEKEFFKGELSELIEIVRTVASKYAPNEKISVAARTKNYENGDRYVGEFEGDLRHGNGTCYYANGDKYNGSWEEDLQHGHGTYATSNGTEYLGNWQNGQRQGIGSEICVEEEWRAQEIHEIELYIGEWKSDNRNGQGFVFLNTTWGDIYPKLWFGGFLNGKPAGDFYYWFYDSFSDTAYAPPPGAELKKFKSFRTDALIPDGDHCVGMQVTPDYSFWKAFAANDELTCIRDAFSYEDLVPMIDDLKQAETLMKKITAVREKYRQQIKISLSHTELKNIVNKYGMRSE